MIVVLLCLTASATPGCGRIGFALGRGGDPTADGGTVFDASFRIDGSALSDAALNADAADSGENTSDSGPIDGSTELDAGGETGGCPPGLTGTYFCDSFEEIPGVWSYNAGALRETTVVRTGVGSARFELADNTMRDLGHTSLPDAPDTGSVYFRAYVFIAGGGNFNRIEIASFGSTNDPGTGRFDRIGININNGWYSIFNGMENAEYLASGATIPRDRWFCIELDVDIDASSGRVTLRADGTEEVTSAGINTAAFEGYDFVNVGGVFLQGVSNMTVYVDDIVLSRQPIGC